MYTPAAGGVHTTGGGTIQNLQQNTVSLRFRLSVVPTTVGHDCIRARHLALGRACAGRSLLRAGGANALCTFGGHPVSVATLFGGSGLLSTFFSLSLSLSPSLPLCPTPVLYLCRLSVFLSVLQCYCVSVSTPLLTGAECLLKEVKVSKPFLQFIHVRSLWE